MDKTFVRRSFYVSPPSKNASVKEWNNWLRQDERAAKNALGRFNRANKRSTDVVEKEDLEKVDGVFKQNCCEVVDLEEEYQSKCEQANTVKPPFFIRKKSRG